MKLYNARRSRAPILQLTNPLLGATGPLEYYDDILYEIQNSDFQNYYDVGGANVVTPIKGAQINQLSLIARQEGSRMNEVQPGNVAIKDLVGPVSRDPLKMNDLVRAQANPSLAPMVSTCFDDTATGYTNDITKFFTHNYYPDVQELLQRNNVVENGETVGYTWQQRPQSCMQSAVNGTFCHQTVNSDGGMFGLDEIGTSAQFGAGTDSVKGVSSWRPVNMINLSGTMNAARDMETRCDRGHDCRDNTTQLKLNNDGELDMANGNAQFWNNADPTQMTTSTTGRIPGDTVDTDNQPVYMYETGQMVYGARVVDHDSRLLCPNYANDWVKLWREDLYDKLNKQKNIPKNERPYGSALTTERSKQKTNPLDQVGDDWLKPGERPTGAKFGEKYKFKKKTRVLVEPKSMITYQFFAAPGIEGDSRLLSGDILKENAVSLYDPVKNASTIDGASRNVLNDGLTDEFREAIDNQKHFFDQRSRVCMVFVSGEPQVRQDGLTDTTPCSVNYEIKTLEKVKFVPKFYSKMQRLTHALEFTGQPHRDKFDSEYHGRDDQAYEDFTSRSFKHAIDLDQAQTRAISSSMHAATTTGRTMKEIGSDFAQFARHAGLGMAKIGKRAYDVGKAVVSNEKTIVNSAKLFGIAFGAPEVTAAASMYEEARNKFGEAGIKQKMA